MLKKALEVCDHYWEYIKGTKEGVIAMCTKCNIKRRFTWFEWKTMSSESKFLGTTRFR